MNKAGMAGLGLVLGSGIGAVVAFGPLQGDPRIARVEEGLLPAITFAGEPRGGMSLKDRLAHYQVPGISVAVVEDGAVAWARAWGASKAEDPRAVTAGTPFQAGSVSKTVAALLVLRLVSQGRLGLDDPVNARLKSWKLPDSAAGGAEPVTIRHLLTHSAGLARVVYPATDPAAASPSTLDLLQGKGQDAVEAVRPVTRVEPPGRRFAYSNAAYLVLQQLLEDVSGRTFDELARAELFVPLGMADSSFACPLPAALFERAAWGHAAAGAGRAQAIPSKGLAVPAAVGGLWTTPADLARLLAAFLGSYHGSPGAIISPALAREAMRPQVESQGLCAALEGTGGELRMLQTGALPGFLAYLVGYPELRRGAVVMLNADGGGGELAREVMRAVAAEYRWPGFVPAYQRAEMPCEALAQLPGQYEFDNPAFPKIQVTLKECRLYWADREMVPVTGGGFVVPSAGIEVRFVRDAPGGAVRAAEFRVPGMRRTTVTRTGGATTSGHEARQPGAGTAFAAL